MDLAGSFCEPGSNTSMPTSAPARTGACHRTAQPGDAETGRLYEAISSPKMLAEFNPDVGEWGHCEAVALSRYDQVALDWLDGVLAS